jgi:hypothetical protein
VGKRKDIHKEMFPVYGGKCLSCKALHNPQGHLEVTTDDTQPGHPVAVVTEASVQLWKN